MQSQGNIDKKWNKGANAYVIFKCKYGWFSGPKQTTNKSSDYKFRQGFHINYSGTLTCKHKNRDKDVELRMV